MQVNFRDHQQEHEFTSGCTMMYPRCRNIWEDEAEFAESKSRMLHFFSLIVTKMQYTRPRKYIVEG